MNTELDELASCCRAAATEKERAEIEDRLWRKVAKKDRAHGGMSEGLSRLFGFDRGKVRHRQFLFQAKLAAAPLWEKIAAGVSVGAVTTILKAARSRRDVALDEAVRIELDKWERRGTECKLPDGSFGRRASGRRLATGPRPEYKRVQGKIRNVISEYADATLSKFEERERLFLLGRLEADLNVVLEDFAKEVRRAKVGEQLLAAAKISRRKVLDACGTLFLKVPRPGVPVDIDEAKRQMRHFAKKCHPDASGDESSRAMFEAVMAAYEDLKTYNDGVRHEPERREDGGV